MDYEGRDDSFDPALLIGLLVVIVLLLAFIWACYYLAKGRRDAPSYPVVTAPADAAEAALEAGRAPGMDSIRAPYTAAIHNSDFLDPDKEPECQNCHLIEMGSMACYEGICPQCGRPPPKYSLRDMEAEMAIRSSHKKRSKPR